MGAPLAIYPSVKVRGLVRKCDPKPKKDKETGRVLEGEFNHFVDIAGFGFAIEMMYVSPEVYDAVQEGEQVITLELEPTKMKDGDFSRACFRPRFTITPPAAPKGQPS